MADDSPAGLSAEKRLALIRAETRFELGLLHDRVNALLTAESFLTIAYMTALASGAAFARVAGPLLAVLGLLLALLAWPGIAIAVDIVLDWTRHQTELLRSDPELLALSGLAEARAGGGRASVDQWRSMLFFRAVPGLFALVWITLTVVALVVRLPHAS